MLSSYIRFNRFFLVNLAFDSTFYLVFFQHFNLVEEPKNVSFLQQFENLAGKVNGFKLVFKNKKSFENFFNISNLYFRYVEHQVNKAVLQNSIFDLKSKYQSLVYIRNTDIILNYLIFFRLNN